MAHDLQDFQGTALTIANDASEQVVYTTTVGVSLTTATVYRIMLAGRMSTRALLPGTFTLTLKLDGLQTVIVSETLLTGVSNSGFAANLDGWIKPDGANSLVALSGAFVQNAGDMVTPPGRARPLPWGQSI